jgi:hypothetical protein
MQTVPLNSYHFSAMDEYNNILLTREGLRSFHLVTDQEYTFPKMKNMKKCYLLENKSINWKINPVCPRYTSYRDLMGGGHF